MTRAPWVGRALAVAEVLVAFAAMHVAFRAFKRFTTWGHLETEAGMNFSPGVAMVVVAVVAIALRRRGLGKSGLTPRPFFANANAGLASLALLVACGAPFLLASVPIPTPAMGPDVAIPLSALEVGAGILVLGVLSRAGERIARAPRVVTLVLLAAPAIAPIAVAVAQGRSFGRELLTILWVLLGAGVGEEVFFRGYVQSRLNESFGRPWRLFGVPFGAGLCGAAALFGAIHVLNEVDYFIGAGRFRWWHGLATASTLYYGWLRERTGSVLAPAVVHGYADLIVRLPHLLAGA